MYLEKEHMLNTRERDRARPSALFISFLVDLKINHW